MGKQGHDIDYVELNVSDIGCFRPFHGNAFGGSFTDCRPDYWAFNDGLLKGRPDHHRPGAASGGRAALCKRKSQAGSSL